MKQPSRSQQPQQPSVEPVQQPEKTYQVVGLLLLDEMPIVFNARHYDLANLTAEEAEYLLQFPGEVPYLKPIND